MENRAMQQLLTGTVHGNTIVLDAPPGVPEGQHVEVIVRICPASSNAIETATKDSEGADFVYTEEDDRILEEIYRARHFPTRPEVEP
jgi:hypothetical protein